MQEKLLGNGRYQEKGKIYTDSVCIITLAEDLLTNEVVVVKKPAYADKNKCAVIMHESKMLDELQHPNIVKKHGLLKENGIPCLVREYLPVHLGINSATFKGFIEEDLLSFVKQVSEGLLYMHKKGYAHLDVKPNNLGARSEDNKIMVKLFDFGHTRYVGAGRHIAGRVGTYGYQAPEVLEREWCSPEADCYALGATLDTLCYERKKGHYFFSGKGSFIHDDAIDSQVTDFLRGVIHKLKEGSPEKRMTIRELYNKTADFEKRTLKHSQIPLEKLCNTY